MSTPKKDTPRIAALRAFMAEREALALYYIRQASEPSISSKTREKLEEKIKAVCALNAGIKVALKILDGKKVTTRSAPRIH